MLSSYPHKKHSAFILQRNA